MAPTAWPKPNAGYSTLEHDDFRDNLPEVAPSAYADHAEHLRSGNLQVAHEMKGSELPQVVSTTEYMYPVPLDSNTTPNYLYNGKGAQTTDSELNRPRSVDSLICGLRRRVFWILVCSAALLILVAALGGALGATAGKGSSNVPSTGQSSIPMTPTTTTLTAGTTSSPASATATGYTGLRSNSHLAAVAFYDDEGGQQYAVYYQDEKNSIKQSLWNSSLQTWNVSYVWTASDVMSGGAFGASVNFVGSTYQIELYYVGTDNNLKELYLVPGAKQWGQGYATSQHYTADTKSSLVLADNLCPQYCDNNLLWFWQDTDENIRVGNSSAAVGLNSNIIVKNALEGTPISATPFPVGDGPLNYALFYYNSDSQLQVRLWSPAQVTNISNSTGEGWTSPTTLGTSSTVGSLTSFSSGNGSTVTVVISSQDGLQLISINLNAEGEIASTKTPSDSTLDSLTGFSSIAINAENQFFGIANGTIQQYSMQGNAQTWSLVGTVPTK